MRSLACLSLALLASPVLAQEAPVDTDDGAADDVEITENEIVVYATRMRGQVDAPQPPVMVLDEEEIASYGVSSLTDLISALSPQTGSGRGRGDGRPVILFNGRRISNFREFRNIPPEAIRRMEVLPEEVALRYGYSANQRVVNFILKDDFSSRTVSAEYGVPTRGGFSESELEAGLLKIDGATRLNLNVESKDTSLLTEAERDVVQQGDPGVAGFRSLVADSRELTATGSWSTGIGNAGSSLSLNAEIGRSDSLSLSGLRTLDDPLTRRTRTVNLSGGAALNTSLGTWQVTATADATQGKSESRIDRLADAGFDRALTRNRSLDTLLTVSGTPFKLPAGEVSVTVKGGFDYTGIRSTDTRSGGNVTKLDRGDLSTGVNLSLPITSRGEDVLAGVGDISLNFSAGLNRLSDFGTLKDWSAGVTWSPTDKLGFQASYLVNDAAPSLADLGNPSIVNLNVPVYDFSRGETALVSVTTGGNPALVREKQRDLKIAANWELPFLKSSNLIVEYFRNRSSDVTASFPVLTPEIEAAFPGRVVRDGSGRLVSIDRRPVTFDQTKGSRLRYGFNVSGTIGKPAAGAREETKTLQTLETLGSLIKRFE